MQEYKRYCVGETDAEIQRMKGSREMRLLIKFLHSITGCGYHNLKLFCKSHKALCMECGRKYVKKGKYYESAQKTKLRR